MIEDGSFSFYLILSSHSLCHLTKTVYANSMNQIFFVLDVASVAAVDHLNDGDIHGQEEVH